MVSLLPDQVRDEIAEPHRFAVDLGIGEQRPDVRTRRGAAAFEQILCEGKEFGQRPAHRLWRLAELGIVLPDEGVGPVIELKPAFRRQAEQFGERQQRQRRRQQRHEVDGLTARHPGDQRGGPLFDSPLDAVEPRRRQRGHNELAIAGVDRRIARDERDADRRLSRAGQPDLILVEDAVAAILIGRREDIRPLRHLDDVRMPQDRPEARTVTLGIPVDRVLAPKLREDRVRHAILIEAGILEIGSDEGGHRDQKPTRAEMP